MLESDKLGRIVRCEYSILRGKKNNKVTKQDAFDEINRIQDEYVDELVDLINSSDYEALKSINFTSPTGTGKTKMMSKLINRFPDYYFIVTTLSKGQLHLQVRKSLEIDCNQENFYVYGSADYKVNSKLDAETIIGRIPTGVKCIWLRDEGHIRTNRYDELLSRECFKVINFSATNKYSDIRCNFTQTMMLRTVNQTSGTPEDAIDKLLEIKEAHKDVTNYNPCGIFRCISGKGKIHDCIVNLCKEKGLKYIDITDESFVMAELCEDDNEYDVIINKFKIVEGIDIRRAHVLYMDSQPNNPATTIQAIGRCRRNALFYRDDIDILDSCNQVLLENTRECYVYYNIKNMKIDPDENGELQYAFCNYISCEELNSGTIIEVIDGQLSNGLHILELQGKTGQFKIEVDGATGFNVVTPITDFYETVEEEIIDKKDYIIVNIGWNRLDFRKIYISDINKFPISESYLNYPQYYIFSGGKYKDMNYHINDDIIAFYDEQTKKYTAEYLDSIYSQFCLENINDSLDIFSLSDEILEAYIDEKDIHKDYLSILWDITKRNKEYKVDKSLLLFLKYCCIIGKDAGYNDDTIKLLVIQIFDLLKYCENIILKKKLIYLIFCCDYKFDRITLDSLSLPAMSVNIDVINKLSEYHISKNDIESYFFGINKIFNSSVYIFITRKVMYECINNYINGLYSRKPLEKINIYYSYDSLYHPISKLEGFLLRNAFLKSYSYDAITKKEYKRLLNSLQDGFGSYCKITNDRESSIIGVDLMRQTKDSNNNVFWVENSTVTSKIDKYNKFNRFISLKYIDELKQGKDQLFGGNNDFDLNSKLNSMVGYCVEYYSKYIIYGMSFLNDVLDDRDRNGFRSIMEDYQDLFEQSDSLSANEMDKRNSVIVYLCMKKYKQMMIRSFGLGVSRRLHIIPLRSCLDKEYKYFINLIVELGTKTADYVRKMLYNGIEPKNNIDPNLSIRHITGLADYIMEDTILDVKVRNNIDEKCIRQVLAYHYLSTKRSDLDIKRVIVYDATSGRDVVIDITDKNRTHYSI